MVKNVQNYDIVIIGGGVIGTSLLFLLSKYTNVKRVALLEKHANLGQVASHSKNNSQTLHFGDIETNYTYEKAEIVNKAANLVVNYLEKFDSEKKLYKKFSKMVLAVGDKQVNILKKRYDEFKDLFPDLKNIDAQEIAKIEPKVVEGRQPDEIVSALYTKQGYTVDFGGLAESFAKQAKNLAQDKIDLYLKTRVKKITKTKDGWHIQTNNGEFEAKFLVVSAGSYSLYFAKMLGYGREYSILPVAGDFYHVPKVLNGKVYTLQSPKITFAAIHGDPDLDYPNSTRFGPVAKILCFLEPRNYVSLLSFFKTFGLSWSALMTLFRLAKDKVMGPFILRHFLYSIPWVGKCFFIKEIRCIVPSLRVCDIRKAKGVGGIRPQVIDKSKRWLAFGDAKISDHNILFNITPSPGASMCLRIALDDLHFIVKYFDTEIIFDKEAFVKDFD